MTPFFWVDAGQKKRVGSKLVKRMSANSDYHFLSQQLRPSLLHHRRQIDTDPSNPPTLLPPHRPRHARTPEILFRDVAVRPALSAAIPPDSVSGPVGGPEPHRRRIVRQGSEQSARDRLREPPTPVLRFHVQGRQTAVDAQEGPRYQRASSLPLLSFPRVRRRTCSRSRSRRRRSGRVAYPAAAELGERLLRLGDLGPGDRKLELVLAAELVERVAGR